MVDIRLNGVMKTLPGALSVEELVDQLGYDRRRIAVEVNEEVVPRTRHSEHHLQTGDAVEIVTLVGGGSQESEVRSQKSEVRGQKSLTPDSCPLDKPLQIGKFTFQS